METNKPLIAALYDRSAISYDQVGPSAFGRFGRRLVALANIPTGAHVLDVGAGRGANLFPTAERVGVTGQVVGIDLSPAMVNETNTEIRRRGINNAEMR